MLGMASAGTEGNLRGDIGEKMRLNPSQQIIDILVSDIPRHVVVTLSSRGNEVLLRPSPFLVSRGTVNDVA